MTTSTRPSIKVQRNRGWSKPEDRIPVSGLPIPDLWGIEQRLEEAGEGVAKARNALVEDDVAAAEAALGEIPIKGKLHGASMGRKAIDCWHVAHDLQRLVAHTIELAVDSALEKLRILKDSMDTEGAPQKYELQAVIDILSRVYRDGEPE